MPVRDKAGDVEMMEELLPLNIALDECWDDDLSASLLPEEAAQLGSAIESRTREFTTGRSCARRALGKLGFPPASILRGPNREPLWPLGVVGSITHCKGFRAAAVALQADFWALGIDAEIHDALPAEVVDHVLLKPEIAWFAKAPNGIHWDRVVFSAKECVYKAWFPLTHRWLGFEDVQVDLRPTEGTFNARLLVDSTAIDGQALTEMAGRFMVRNGLILTVIAEPAQLSSSALRSEGIHTPPVT
jgi:4'-phosphopantetheinyl transferase EntD